MTLIQRWAQNGLGHFAPIRTIATVEPRCNLACEHCYWAHDINEPVEKNWSRAVENLASIRKPLFFAGRVLNNTGANFLRLCLERDAVSELGIVDNGYTILKYPDLLPAYKSINISIDGSREGHDRQRGKAGAFDTAWSAVLKLKTQGYDPIVSSAVSPLNVDGWNDFEQLLVQNDVPVSATLVWDLPNTKARGGAVFTSVESMQVAFQLLVNGIPKLINIYSLEQVKVLWPILKSFNWEVDTDSGDCLITTLGNGVTVVYRPASLVSVAEQSLEWDGIFYTPFTYGKKMPVSQINQVYTAWVRSVNQFELEIWNEVLKIKFNK